MNTLIKALNDPTRRAILEMLKNKDMTAGDIANEFSISKPSISHHLDLLKQAELVVAIKRGQFIHYSINTSVLEELMGWILTITKNWNHEKTNHLSITYSPTILNFILLESIT